MTCSAQAVTGFLALKPSLQSAPDPVAVRPKLTARANGRTKAVTPSSRATARLAVQNPSGDHPTTVSPNTTRPRARAPTPHARSARPIGRFTLVRRKARSRAYRNDEQESEFHEEPISLSRVAVLGSSGRARPFATSPIISEGVDPGVRCRREGSDEPARIPHRSGRDRRDSSCGRPGTPGLLGGAVVRADWLARHTEPILEPDLPIVDPHHHLQPPAGRTLINLARPVCTPRQKLHRSSTCHFAPRRRSRRSNNPSDD
jgi:hypothetical protein